MITLVTINKLGLEGQGVGADPQGNLYFVKGTLPGDSVRVEYAETTKRFRDATLVEIVTPSPDRVSSACTYFPECGGCDWLDLSYPAQLSAKSSLLTHVLERAEIHPKQLFPVMASPQTEGYRTRIQVRAQESKVGFYKRGSNDIVDIDRCLVADDTLNEAIRELKQKVPGPNLHKIELYSTKEGAMAVWDEPHAAQGFTQVNTAQNDQMKKRITEWMKAIAPTAVLELYCGDGNFTDTFWDLVGDYQGVDANEVALQKARERFAETAAKKFVAGTIDARTWKSLPAAFQSRCDTLVLDPPRSGVGKSLNSFLRPSVRNIIYISCSQLTFSWDAKLISQQGFHLAQLQPVDMFPHTRHLEIMALFTRGSAA